MNYPRLDEAFLKFVNLYLKEQRFKKPPDIFRAMEKTKTDPLGSCLETTRYQEDGRIYWNENDYIKWDRELISKEDAHLIDKTIVSEERLMNAVNEFRRFLLEYPVLIIYSKEQEGDRQILSNKLFATSHSFMEILNNKFFSYEGHDLYIDGEGLEQAFHLFQGGKDPQRESEQRHQEVQVLKADKNAYCAYILFGLFKYKDILEQFPEDKAYAEDGEVCEFLKKEYCLSQYMATRVIVPSLKALKGSVLPIFPT